MTTHTLSPAALLCTAGGWNGGTSVQNRMSMTHHHHIWENTEFMVESARLIIIIGWNL